MLSVYDVVMWTYYAAHCRRPPEPARFILAQPGWVQEGGAVLDFGGGDGRWALPLATARASHVTVADIDAAALRYVPPHPLLRPMLLNGPTLPFPNDAYHLVFVHHVIHHIENLPPVLHELRRVVGPGGRIVCVEFRPECTVTRVYRLLSRFRRRPCTFYTPEALAGLLGVHPFIAVHRMVDNFQYVVSAHRADHHPVTHVQESRNAGLLLTQGGIRCDSGDRSGSPDFSCS